MNDYVGQTFSMASTVTFRTLIDAVDSVNVGQLRVIGSYDLLGDLFILSTTNTRVKEQFTITAATNLTPITVTTSEAHNLIDGQNAYINSVLGNTGANGNWIVYNVTSTTFELRDSTGTGAYTSGGVLFTNTQGIAEIGVAQKSSNNAAWTYTKLIRSRQLNFSTLHQQDFRAELDGVKKSLYFTDDYNKPKVMYYYGDYVTNGFLTADYTQGKYDLNTVGAESILLVGSPNVLLGVTQASGGSVLCGNWRYAVRFGFEGGVYGEWSYLSNPINVYAGDNIGFINGGEGNVKSNKLNIITVTNVSAGLYTRVELAAVQYINEIFVGGIAKSQAINPIQTTIEITHEGSEVAEFLDVTFLNQVFTSITKAQNLELLDNRLSLSNVEVLVDQDLSAWATTINYTVKKDTINNMGNVSTSPSWRMEEYYKPSNVQDKIGYMINETYRCGVQVKWKNASWSSVYFVADVLIDTSGASGQRLGGLNNYNLGDLLFSTTFVPYIEWTNVDLDFQLTDGSLLRDNIEQIRFVRQKCIPEVLATGILFPSASAAAPDLIVENKDPFEFPLVPTFAPDWTNCKFISPDIYYQGSFPSTNIVFNVFAVGWYEGGGNQTITASAPTNSPYTYDIDVDYAEYSGYQSDITTYLTYVPNTITNETYFSQDVIAVNFPAPAIAVNDIPNEAYISIAQIFRTIPNKYGATNTGIYETTNCNSIDIDNITIATIFDMFGGDAMVQRQYKRIANITLTVTGLLTRALKYYVAGFYSQNRVNSQMQLNISDTDRTLPGKKGSVFTWVVNSGADGGEPLFPGLIATPTTYPSVTYSYNKGYTPTNNIQSYNAFDATVTQIESQPTRIYWSEIKAINSLADQYRIILPLNYRDLEPAYGEIVDMKSINKDLFTWQPRSFQRQYFNTAGTLSSSDNSQILVGDGSVMGRSGDELSMYGTQHKWSVIKGVTQGGKDTVYWINTENKKVMRFGSDGTVVLSDRNGMQSWFSNNLGFAQLYATPADNLGIHGVYDNRFQEAIFTIRAKIASEYTILLASGDVMNPNSFYYNSLNRDFNGFYTYYKPKSIFLLNNTKMPETGADWETYFDKITTDNNQAYNLYTIALNEYRNKFTTYYSFEPKIYLQHRNGILSQHPTLTPVYEHNRGNFCEWYKSTITGSGTITAVSGSNQVTGSGSNFSSQFENMEYINYQLVISGTAYEIDSVQTNFLLTLKDVSAVSYSGAYTYTKSLSEDGSINMLLNEQPNVVKMFNANRLNTKIEPMRVEFATENHESYLEETDFEEVEDQFDSAIKMDSTVSVDNLTGSNEADTSRLWGKYIKVNLFFEKRTYQKLYNAFVKYTPKARLFNK